MKNHTYKSVHSTDYNAGSYFITVISGDKVITKKFLIVR